MGPAAVVMRAHVLLQEQAIHLPVTKQKTAQFDTTDTFDACASHAPVAWLEARRFRWVRK
jgi:hypothetical protein